MLSRIHDGGTKTLNREQTATLQTALLHGRCGRVRTQMRTAQRGSIPVAWTVALLRHQGLVELAAAGLTVLRGSDRGMFVRHSLMA